MDSNIDKPRRSFVIAGAAATMLVATGASGSQGEPSDRQLQFSSLAAAEEELARLAQATELVSAATWTWPQTLMHCAQSIEYSMTGYPQPKSALFQHTLGAAAFRIFSWRGRMSHDLSEPIPGAPALEAGLDPAQALDRLRGAIRSFQQWSGPLQAHFAYGALDKSEYELAHAMHLANHLSSFRANNKT